MEKARRRRHVPAFGEWNYYYSPSSSSPDEPELAPRYGGAAAAGGDWCWYAPEPAACTDDVVWFRYSPSPSPQRPRKPAPKKERRRPEAEVVATPEKLRYGGGKAESISIVVPVERVLRGGPADADGDDVAAGAVAGRRAQAQAKTKGARRVVVVRPVDEDLYQVPPPDLGASSRPRRKRAARRTLWMGCLGGLSCVA